MNPNGLGFSVKKQVSTKLEKNNDDSSERESSEAIDNNQST